MAWGTKLPPAPVPYPNGGGLKVIMEKKNATKKLEHDKIDLQAKIDHAKVEERYKPKPPTTKKPRKQ